MPEHFLHKILDSATSKLQVKIKEAMNINQEKHALILANHDFILIFLHVFFSA